MYVFFVIYGEKDGREQETARFPHNERENASEFARLTGGWMNREKRTLSGELSPKARVHNWSPNFGRKWKGKKKKN